MVPNLENFLCQRMIITLRIFGEIQDNSHLPDILLSEFGPSRLFFFLNHEINPERSLIYYVLWNLYSIQNDFQKLEKRFEI